MAAAVPVAGFCWARQPAALLGRIESLAGELIDQAAVDAIAYTVARYITPGDEPEADDDFDAADAGDVADLVFDAAQTDSRWPTEPGYNFAHTVPAAAFPRPGLYRVAYAFTKAGQAVAYARYEIQAR